MVTTTNRTVLHVTGFSVYLRARDLAYEFERYGRLVRCDIPALKSAQATPFAFIEFRREDDAEDAYHDMHGRAIEGRRISVQWAKRPPNDTWRHVGAPVGDRGIRNNTGRDDRRGGRVDDNRREPPRHRSPSPSRSSNRDRSPPRRSDRDPSPPRRNYGRDASPPRRSHDDKRRSLSPRRDDRDKGDARRENGAGDYDKYGNGMNGRVKRNGSGRDDERQTRSRSLTLDDGIQGGRADS